MSDEEAAAFHESAHAVFAAFGRWTKLGGPVTLEGCGGDVVMSTDGEAIRRSIAADPAFDRDLPRIELISALLAGPIAERMLIERGRFALHEDDLRAACGGDYRVIAAQLGQIDPPRPDLLPRLEREVRRWLERPRHWAAIERFAAILLERRRLEAKEANAILAGLRPKSRLPFFALSVALAAVVLGALWRSLA